MADTARYDATSQALHWLTAIAILGAFLLAQFFDAFARGDPRASAIALHRSIGFIVLVMVALRLAWRFVRAAPPAPPRPRWVELSSIAVHAALYVLMLTICVLGLFATWTHGRDVVVFGVLKLPTMYAANKAWYDPLENIHGLLADGLMVLAGLHAGAAIFHQFVMKDRTLARMVPFLR